jgi:uncharacterized protein (TIGR03435 family)
VPSFEVASVKPADPSQRAVDLVISPGGRLRAVNVTLTDMLREAYQVKYYQVSGGPGWMESARFNIEAQAPGEPGRNEMMAMLRTLLVERFQLKVRREMREGNVFELVVAKGGPKLKTSMADRSYISTIRNTPPELPGISYTVLGQKASMAKLADDLKGWVERPVFDRTGLAGEYDFKVDFAIEGHLDAGPSIFTALPEQLGLKLQAAKGPIETLVIEKAERPTEN